MAITDGAVESWSKTGVSFPLGGDGGIVWLVLINAGYLLVGTAAFGLGEHNARHQGSLHR